MAVQRLPSFHRVPTHPSPDNAGVSVAEYSAKAFHRALGSPFAVPLSARLSAAPALCARAYGLISASTVYADIKPLFAKVVKSFGKIFAESAEKRERGKGAVLLYFFRKGTVLPPQGMMYTLLPRKSI